VTALLEVRDLAVTFDTPAGEVRAVRGVSFDVERGETVALVGESGSGKTVTALSILQLLPSPPARHPSGSIRFAGQELLGAPEPVLRRVRGNRIAMIFQEPMTSLNPLHPIGRQVSEPLLVHRALGRAAARARAVELLRLVGLPEAEARLDAYPHQLSEGMRQRVAIARALATDPAVLLMDEPFANLDEQHRLLLQDELLRIWEASGKTVLFVTHSLDEALRLADRVLVMTARPGRLKAEVPVPLPRPRDYREVRRDPQYGALSARLWELLRAEVVG